MPDIWSMSAEANERAESTKETPKLGIARQLLLFFPLLLLYVVVALGGAHLLGAFETQIWDESRYLGYADNLSHGFYSPPGDVQLANGPGYPLVLLPVVALGIAPVWAKLLNVFFIFGAVLYLHRSLRLWTSARTAWIAAGLFGLHIPLLSHLPLLYTESLIALQMSGFVYHFLRTVQSRPLLRGHLIGAALWFAALALTKVFFGYVVLTTLLASLIGWGLTRTRALRRLVVVSALALGVCLPYLIYTYSLTGKVFYWSTYGGASLYWMSSPYSGDHGDWMGNTYEQVASRAEDREAPELLTNHGPFFQTLEPLNQLERDDAFRAEAIRNIKAHPLAFLGNWVANLGRLFFEYPFSHLDQTMGTYLFMFPNMFLFVALAVTIPLSMLKRKTLPEGLPALILIVAIATGGSSLLSAYFRQMIPLFPILFLWIATVFEHSIRIVKT